MHKNLLFLFFIFSVSSLVGQQACSLPKITDAAGNENPVINCSYPLTGKCLQLKATFPEFWQTTSYAVSSQNFTPYGAFNDGKPLYANEEQDDLFFNKISIPFDFCFFGKNYSEIVIGSNGVVTFDLEQLGSVNIPNVTDQNPNSALQKNSIFGPLSDLVFSAATESEIYYHIIGAAPCRKLVVNYYKGRLVGCQQTVTSQIVLSEGSNEIEIFIENKPDPCAAAQFKNSLIGIINEEGTIGYSPVGRNTGVWQTANEAWKFTPNGSVITPQIEWFNQAKQKIGSGAVVSVCPKNDESYSVKVTYPNCGGENYVLENTSLVSFAMDYPLANDFTKVLCESTSINVDLNDYRTNLTSRDPAKLNFKFYNSAAEAQVGGPSEPAVFVLNSSRTFHVRVENRADSACFQTAILKLNLIGASLLTTTVDICDSNNDGIEKNYQLSKLNSQLFNLPINGTIHYYGSLLDANSNNEITRADISSTSEFFVKYKTSTCDQIFGPIKIIFLSSPLVNSPVTFSLTTCDFRGDSIEPFDYKGILGPLVSANPDSFLLKFYSTYDQAYSGAGASLTTIKSGQYNVFVRVEESGGCFSIATVNLDITFTKVAAINKQVNLCYGGSKNVTINLDDYSPEMLIDSPNGITTSYYSSLASAESNPSSPISNVQTVTYNGDFVTKVFYVKFTDATDCYAVKELKINLIHINIKEDVLSICDFENNGVENVTLSSLTNKIKGNQVATVKYFNTRNEAETYVPGATTELTNYNFVNTTTATLFVRIESYECVRVFEIKLNLVATPVVSANIPVVKEAVCDNNNDGQEPFDLTQFQSDIYSGSEAVNFQYYRNFNPANNSLTSEITNPTFFAVAATSTVYVKVSFKNTLKCYSVSTINIQLNFLPAIVLKPATLKQCSFKSTLNESYDLTEALPQIFNQAENTNDLSVLEIRYYLKEADANVGDPSQQISSTFISSYSSVIVWVRYTSTINNCYSIAPIELKTYLPPKVKSNIVISKVCDNNLDGSYDVNLLAFTDLMVDLQNSENIFTFFETQLEAEDPNGIPISNPDSYNINLARPQVWVRVQNIPGCYATAPVDFSFGDKIQLGDYGPFLFDDTCDNGNEGIETVDLTKFENTIFSGATFEYYPSLADLNQDNNRISTPTSYIFNENVGPNKIFVKVSNTGFCPEKIEINLSLKKTPMFILPEDGYFFCPEGYVDIKPDFSGLDIVSYEWRNPAGEIVSTTNELLKADKEGMYNLKVTASNNCFYSIDFQISAYEVPIITDLIATGNSYTVIATGSKKILYAKNLSNSTNPGPFTENNVFPNLPPGVTTFYVKFEGSGCIGERKEGLILNIKNVITPNADGINDTWSVDNLDVFEGRKATLKIFNRAGQNVFKQESATRLEWDGTFNSRPAPTDSYWYVLTLADGRVFTGWILVKNR